MHNVSGREEKGREWEKGRGEKEKGWKEGEPCPQTAFQMTPLDIKHFMLVTLVSVF